MKKNIFFLISLFLLISCTPSESKTHGYVEGDFILIAPTSSGILKTLSIARGQHAKQGYPLFSLDLTELTAELNSHSAEIKLLQAELDDLLKGKRPEKIKVIQTQKKQAQIELINTQKEYERILPLSKKGIVSVARLDKAKTAFDNAKAQLEEINAELQTSKLGARIDQVGAAKARLEAAKHKLTQIEKKLEDAKPTMPSDGIIYDVFYEIGEYVNSGRPVVSVLSPENVKIRFYVSQEEVARIKLGQSVKVSCDGCESLINATISYISPNSEYTPPVIYSVESRDKLVFLVEAKPEDNHSALRIGLPVSIEFGA